MKKLFWVSLLIILALTLVIGGCSQSASFPTSPPAQTKAPASPTPAQSAVSAPTQSAIAAAPAKPSDTATPSQSPSASGPQKGGTLKIIATIVFSDIGYPPTVVGDQIYAEPAVETLVTLDGQGKAQIIPQLATAWQYSADNKSLTFNLRKGVKFHDGTDFNAQAAKFCMDMIKTSGQGLLSSVASIDVVDDYTIRLNLSSYSPSLLADLTATRNGMMVSPTAIKSMSKEESMTHPVGTGPFKFASYQRSVALKYVKNADYWQTGKPYLDGIDFVFVADPVTALASFQAGEGQALRSPSPKDSTNLESTGKFKIYRNASSVRGLAFDSANSNSPYYDLKVRQAVCYAADIEAINKACGYGLPMTRQFAVPDIWYYNSAVTGYPYNPQKAKELLSQTSNAKGFSTNIYYENAGAMGTMCTAMQSYLRDVGIDAKLVLQERAAFIQTRTGGWNNGMVWFDINFSSASDLSARLLPAISSKGTDYKSILVPPDYDAKLLQASVESDKAKSTALSQELEKMLIDTYCLAIPCYVNATFTATNLQVRDFNFNNYGQGIWDPENTWLSK
jgi:peptide/nickel transport system substrate-binding protein